MREVISAVETEMPAEHGEKRGGIALHALRNGLVGEHADGHKQQGERCSLCGAHPHQVPEIDVGGDIARVQQSAAHQKESQAQQVAGLYVRHDEGHEGDQKDDDQRAGTQYQSGERGGIAQVLLRQLRNEDGASI